MEDFFETLKNNTKDKEKDFVRDLKTYFDEAVKKHFREEFLEMLMIMLEVKDGNYKKKGKAH
jgi:hypothetical protein